MDGALAEAGQEQGIGVAPGGEKCPQRIEDERVEEHASHQEENQFAVGGENLHAAFGNGGEDQAQDAKGRELDNPGYHFGQHGGKVRDHPDGLPGGQGAKAQSHEDGPEQDADVIGLGDGCQRIGHQVGKEVGKDVCERAGGASFRDVRELQGDGEELAARGGDGGGTQGAHKIQADDRTEARSQSRPRLGDRCGDKDKDQKGRNGFEGSYEDGPEKGDAGKAGYREAQDGANDQASEDAEDQAGLGPFPGDGF